MQITLETTIDAPREAVFAHVVAIARWPAVIRGIETVEMLTEGPVRVGSRFRETRLMHGTRATEEMTVAVLAPPELLVLTAESHGTRYRVEHRLALEGKGTRLALVFAGQPATLLARLLMPLGLLFAGAVRRQIAADLEDLKRAAEAGTRRPA